MDIIVLSAIAVVVLAGVLWQIRQVRWMQEAVQIGLAAALALLLTTLYTMGTFSLLTSIIFLALGAILITHLGPLQLRWP